MKPPVGTQPLPRSLHDRATRRQFIGGLAGSLAALGSARATASPPSGPQAWLRPSESDPDVRAQVTPADGIRTKVALSDSIVRLVAADAIDPDKYRDGAERLPDWVERVLTAPSDEPIVFSRATAPYLLTLLWALGMANRAAFNANSPIGTVRIPGFASTGGWRLGRRDDGYVYFNSVDAVSLTERQEAMVFEAATQIYRPCCDNATFFQDCNHGSAMLGLLELAASQGAKSHDLFRLAVTANAYWFPDNYARIALHFAHFHLVAWQELDPRLVLSRDLSSASGWLKNIDEPLRRAGVKLRGESEDQQNC